MLYKEFLKEKYVQTIYESIENNPRIPISHGTHHILNVLNYCERLSYLFELDEKEKETLFLAAVMHDVAQVFLQPNHAKNGAFIVKEMLENNETIDPLYIKSKVDIDKVCSIIANHGGKKEEEYEDKLSALLILADKLDYTKDRIRDEYVKYDFLHFMVNIDKIELNINDDTLIVEFITNKEITFDELNDKQGLQKTLKTIEMFSNRFNLNHKIITKHNQIKINEK